MTKKKYLFITAVVTLSVFIISASTHKKAEDDLLQVQSVMITQGNGWGYEILVDHKLYIKQQYIPAIQGMHPFASPHDAQVTANAVIQKIVHGKLPKLTVDELKQLQIKLP